MKYFTTTKDFSVGDLLIQMKDDCYYIASITQYREGYQYEYELVSFSKYQNGHRYLNTHRLKNNIRYSKWKHYRVVKP